MSRTTRQFDDINGGKPFPYKYDRRHDFSIVVNHEFNENISFSATWVYSTGDALTLATNHYGVLFHDYNSLTGIGIIDKIQAGKSFNNSINNSFEHLKAMFFLIIQSIREHVIWNLFFFVVCSLGVLSSTTPFSQRILR